MNDTKVMFAMNMWCFQIPAFFRTKDTLHISADLTCMWNICIITLHRAGTQQYKREWHLYITSHNIFIWNFIQSWWKHQISAFKQAFFSTNKHPGIVHNPTLCTTYPLLILQPQGERGREGGKKRKGENNAVVSSPS